MPKEVNMDMGVNGCVQVVRVARPARSEAETILAQLEAALPDEVFAYNGQSSFVATFLEEGANLRTDELYQRHPEADSLWGKLSHAQFVRALELCLTRSPRLFLKYLHIADFVFDRLDADRASALRIGLVRLAADQLSGDIGSEEALEELNALSLATRLELAQRLIQNHRGRSLPLLTRFLVKTALELEQMTGDGTGANWLQEMLRRVPRVDSLMLYRAARSYQQWGGWTRFVSWLEAIVMGRLQQEAVLVARVEIVTHPFTGSLAYGASDGQGAWYLHDYGGDRIPRNGEWVFICLEEAEVLDLDVDGMRFYTGTLIPV